MGLFFKKKIIGEHPHEVSRKDWENVMDALFRNMIANNAKGVAVICNTNRENQDDGAGIIQGELIYRIKAQRVDEVREGLKKIDMFHFENVFKTYFDSEHEKGLDFYRMKNILDKEIIVYPLVQGKYKKGLLVFEYPISDSNMSHIMQVIKGVLNNPEVQSSPTPDSSSENETKNN